MSVFPIKDQEFLPFLLPKKTNRLSIGFTGTQKGMNKIQISYVEELLEFLSLSYDLITAHHGDCYGADENFHDLCLKFGIRIVIHPPEDKKKRAFCEYPSIIFDPYPYLVRNKNIVKSSDIVIATPLNEEEIVRSGTWSTVRFARETIIPTIIIKPSGISDLDSNDIVYF